MHILKVLDPIEKLESSLSDLYEWFSSLFAADAEASGLFFSMGIDETAHANMVKYQRRLVVHNSKLFESSSVDITSIEDVLSQVHGIRSGEPPSLEAAVLLALEFEKDAAEAHYRTAITEVAPPEMGLHKLLGGLAAMDARHLAAIWEFALRRGFAPASGSAPVIETLLPPEVPPGAAAEVTSSLPPDLIEKIEYYFEWHDTMDYYKLLGVKNYANSDEIKHSFHSLALDFHPDTHMDAPDEIKMKLNAIFSHMLIAYTTLRNIVKRREYDNMIHTRTLHIK